jgi:moderate conductance mechanosensitive channel
MDTVLIPLPQIPLLRWTDDVVVVPAKIVALVLGFLVLRWFLHKVIRRLARRAAGGSVPSVLARSHRARKLVEQTLLNERRQQRAETVSSLLQSVTTTVLSAVLVLMVLSLLGFNILPVLASASILGVALGFGAQTLVKDFIAGIFMILEDQYGVGDVVDLEKATGTVEAVGLRVTRLRGDDGTIWYVRNGEVLRVGNLTNRETAEPSDRPDDPANADA